MKISRFFAAAALLLSMLVSCGKDSSEQEFIAVSSVSINPPATSMGVGQSMSLDVQVLPDNATDKTCRYYSLDESVVSVNQEGVITTLKAGSSIVYAISKSNQSKKGQCLVTVTEGPRLITKISVVPSGKQKICVGGYVQFIVTKMPSDSPEDITFESENPAVADVIAGGIVTAKAIGETKIHFKSTNCDEVVEISVVKDEITKITVAPESATIAVGATTTLVATTEPLGAKGLVWSSSDPAVATVDQNGVVSGLKEGETTVYVKSDKCEASAKVTVLADVITDITIYPETLNICTGDSYQMAAVVTPSGATATLTWSSDDTAIATVDQTGKVTAVAPGSTTVHVKSAKCEASAEVTVVDEYITSLEISPSHLDIGKGNTLNFVAVVTPDGATGYTWSSDDTSIATVDQTGKVTGVANGETTIRIKSKSHEAAATVSIVEIPVTGIVTVPESVKILAGNTASINVQVFPSNATETIVWSSDDPSIATVDQKGLVNGVALGSTTIRLKTSACEKTVPVTVADRLNIIRVDPLTNLLNTKGYVDDDSVIRVARGETATLQLDLEGMVPLSDWTATCTYFGTDKGQKLIEPKMFWEREVRCTKCWVDWAGGAPTDGSELLSSGDKYFDPLMPLGGTWNPGQVRVGDRAALWCEFYIPRDFSAGTYQGEIEVSAKFNSQTVTARKTFTVQVYNVTLPEEQGLIVINWETGDFNSMDNGQSVYNTIHNTLLPILYRFMNDYGQNAWRLAWGCGNNSTVNEKAKIVDGEIKYDFSVYYGAEMKKIIDNCPAIRQIHGQQMSNGFSDGEFTVNCCVIENNAVVRKNIKASDSRAQAYIKSYMHQLQEYLRSQKVGDGRTYLDLYVQTIADEPNNEKAASYTAIAKAMKEGAPEIPITDAISTDQIDPRYLDYPCPTLGDIERFRAKPGQTQWLYTAMAPQGNYANRFVRLPLIKTRIIHWCNYYYNAVGYLHWGLKYWEGTKDPAGVQHPYDNVQGSIDFTVYLPGGDMYLLYPDYHNVYPSIRACAMRDGIHDYDLLKMVEAKSPSKANEILSKVVKGPASYDLDVAHFRSYRQEMLEYLE